MILIDPRSGNEKPETVTTIDKMVSYIRKVGIPCDKWSLEFADAAFEGNGPEGRILIGVERKSLHDMLNCIDDARYVAHQKIGMQSMYAKSFLIVEGCWRPHDPDGWLMEGFDGGARWGFCRYRSRQTLYSKLRRYLFSVSLSGVIVLYTRDLWHTSYDICELYTYFQKQWDSHTSLIEVQKLAIPDMMGKPSLVRKWAADIEDVGVKLSLEAEKYFRTPINLANSLVDDWLALPRVGIKTAQNIMDQIRGKKR